VGSVSDRLGMGWNGRFGMVLSVVVWPWVSACVLVCGTRGGLPRLKTTRFVVGLRGRMGVGHRGQCGGVRGLGGLGVGLGLGVRPNSPAS